MALLVRGDLHVLGATNVHTIKRCNVSTCTMDSRQRRCHLGKFLTHAFFETTDPSVTEEMKTKISDWHLLKPESLRPIRYLARSPAAHRYLPEIWMLASFHAVALQYYHVAQLVFAISSRTPSANFLDYSRNHQAMEQQVRHHLLHVVGIACPNARAQNT